MSKILSIKIYKKINQLYHSMIFVIFIISNLKVVQIQTLKRDPVLDLLGASLFT